MELSIGPAHWAYLAGVCIIVVTMMCRANVVVPAILATAVVTFFWSGSLITAISSIFSASMVAAKELFNIFLIIALMTALLNSLKGIGADVRMVRPFRKIMTNGHNAYLILAVVTYLISLFFWPTPAIPLVVAVLLPAAIAAGLPPLAGAMAIAIAGQGMALSSDYVIGVAPAISAKAAGGIAPSLVADQALQLSWIVGVVALTLCWFKTRKFIQPGSAALLERWELTPAGARVQHVEGAASFDKASIAQGTAHDHDLPTEAAITAELRRDDHSGASRAFAVITPVAFLAIILLMMAPKLGIAGAPDLKGGQGALVIGGVAALLMICVTFSVCKGRRAFEASAEHVTDGFVFAFKAMGAVLPIAGFFFVGAKGTAGDILGVAAGGHVPDLLFELVQSGQHLLPQNGLLVGFGVLIMGMITGIDGSGFAGLPLTGAVSGALGPVAGVNVSTLAAIGQMGAVWTGGGTLIAWSSLIAVAGFSRVPVMELVRALFLPVLAGLFLAVIGGILIWG
ncbi:MULTISPECIES: hypothetical protein [unclassified Achromobacter]|uniref:hypothetical protein n=1 Tax=unclassified Achromobacter TaxID=2626865 RepID=UPI000B5153FE|nr:MULTISPECIES: hypothetical protein [unclassified Achromobacter]OWT80365.1 hypothetical protein CEY05_02865 [Achromobacter sp. HZ34]OWT82248.1 hypothetical protein CEY04_02865 [Achromobacter sp. HZ28]